MMKKFFLMCLAILLSIQGAAAAESLTTKSKVNIAVEVTDNSRHQDFGTADYLEGFLSRELVKKNLVKVVGAKNLEGELITAKNFSADKIGELLIFDAAELPVPSDTPENFEQTLYKNLGADYVIRCEVLAVGVTKVEDNTLSTIFGATGGILALIGSGSGSHDKTLRRIGTGIGLGGFIITERTALNTVINMQFISVETGQILWQRNFMGLAVKHHKPYKNYDDAWTQAYIESVEKSAEIISKDVNKYVDKVIIQGKSDKKFRTQKFSKGGSQKFF